MAGSLDQSEQDRGLIRYKLDHRTDWIDRYIKQLGTDEFAAYGKKVEKALSVLQKGHCYNISKDVPEHLQELFIKLTCLYIANVDGCIYLEDDYSKVWRNKL